VTDTTVQPQCQGCGKKPEEISEYTDEMTGSGLSPDDYVKQEEGTYNSANGHFLCTSCYIKAGQPSGPRGWICP